MCHEVGNQVLLVAGGEEVLPGSKCEDCDVFSTMSLGVQRDKARIGVAYVS